MKDFPRFSMSPAFQLLCFAFACALPLGAQAGLPPPPCTPVTTEVLLQGELLAYLPDGNTQEAVGEVRLESRLCAGHERLVAVPTIDPSKISAGSLFKATVLLQFCSNRLLSLGRVHLGPESSALALAPSFRSEDDHHLRTQVLGEGFLHNTQLLGARFEMSGAQSATGRSRGLRPLQCALESAFVMIDFEKSGMQAKRVMSKILSAQPKPDCL